MSGTENLLRSFRAGELERKEKRIVLMTWNVAECPSACRHGDLFLSLCCTRINSMVKGGWFHKIRVKQVSVAFVLLICTTILLWAAEKSPLISSLIQSQNQSKTLLLGSNRTKHGSDAVSLTSTTRGKEKNWTLPRPIVNREGCNFAKGQWVEDNKRPLYSGFGCKQWLSPMWACRLTQRKDFSYEGFRWKPEECEMSEFEGSEFLKRMENKTIAFIGDSLGREQFQSLMCMITSGVESPEVMDVAGEYGLTKAPKAIRPDGWVYRFPSTNTTVLYYWSASLCEIEPLNFTKPTEFAMHLDRPATFLRMYLHRFDVLVLNTGHHWNKGKFDGNHWIMYVGGSPNKNPNLEEMTNAKKFTINRVIKWLDSQLPHYPRLKAFFRTISPRHYNNGDWNTGGSCENTVFLAGGNQSLQQGSGDPVVEEAAKGTRVKILDITALSKLRDEGHISRYSTKGTSSTQDCLHWCLPGIPDTWNEILSVKL